MLREGQGEPVALLHGVICSENVWRKTAHDWIGRCQEQK